jgi:hypothetical protein
LNQTDLETATHHFWRDVEQIDCYVNQDRAARQRSMLENVDVSTGLRLDDNSLQPFLAPPGNRYDRCHDAGGGHNYGHELVA